MASSAAIAAVALSLQEVLTRCFAALDEGDEQVFRQLPAVRIVRSEDFGEVGAAPANPIRFPVLSIFCYRVDINRQMRPPWSAVAAVDGRIHLPLDVHFLLTPWDTEPEAELRILGATMQCLEQHPSLSGPTLHPLGGWQAGESVQLVAQDMGTEDILRTFDTLPADFRLSVSYLARITRIDAPDLPSAPEVTTAVRGVTASSVPHP